MVRSIYVLLFALMFNIANAQSVLDIITGSPDHTILEAAILAAELDDDLTSSGNVTIFAPTDAAFNALPAGTVDALLQDPTGDLARILLYHVLGTEVFSNTLSNGQTARTLLGQSISVTLNINGTFINGAEVIGPDLDASNGVVHSIDAVMLPPASTVADVVVNSPDHTILEAAVIAAELADDFSGDGPFTVFAPTDAAFNALPAGTVDALLQDPTGNLARILTYHVLSGEALAEDLSNGQVVRTVLGQNIEVTIDANGVFINNAQVSLTDIRTFNGVVHVLDAVILPPASTVVDVVVNSPDHTILEAAVIAAELADDLSGDGPFTVFAPTDAAFNALPAGTVDALLQDPTGNLARILTYHVLSGEALAEDLSNGQVVRTVLGQNIEITIDANGVFINDAQVSLTDIRTFNGVVHVLDAVILPPASTVVDVVVNSPDHTILEAAVIAAELADDLSGNGPFTVFAPTDAAFNALPAGTVDALLQDPTGDLARILTYHVLGGEALAENLSDGQVVRTLLGQNIEVTIDANGVFINDAQVSVTDIRTFNGVVHVLDAVILPAATVVDVVVNSPDHTILEAAVIAAELADDLSGEGPFTVFAPTDAAFNALPAGTVDALLQDPTGNLARILLYHVVGGEALAENLSNGQVVRTVLGQNIEVTIDANGVFINDAQVSVTDIRTLNGVVHVLDAVILPPASTVVDVVVNSPDHTTLEAAVIAAELADDLSGDGPFTVFAPTDAAFNALPAGTVDALLQDPTGDLARILLYHVVGGEALAENLSNGQSVRTVLGQNVEVTIDANGVFINNAQVSVTDIRTFNGVVHVIDAVMLPPASTIVDVVVNSPDHTTLEAAVLAAQLEGTLSGDGPFTLFAPTDAAFNALPAGTVDALLQDPSGDLTRILQYHVVNGEALSESLSDGQSVNTLLGQSVNVSIDANGILINDAAVSVTDIRTFNGVVHVIDAVLLPELTSIRDLDQVSLQVAPNPASEFINIELPREMWDERVEARLMDAQGRIMDSRILTDTQEKMDVSALPMGTYFLLLQSESKYALSTLIIQ